MLQEAINEFSKMISKRKEKYHYHLLQNKTILKIVLKYIGPY